MNDKTLEELRYYFTSYGSPHDETILKLIEENKRYREAKKQIEEKYEYFQDVPSSVSTGLSMAIEILDKALEESE